jgi:hypothetical protein
LLSQKSAMPLYDWARSLTEAGWEVLISLIKS